MTPGSIRICAGLAQTISNRSGVLAVNQGSSTQGALPYLVGSSSVHTHAYDHLHPLTHESTASSSSHVLSLQPQPIPEPSQYFPLCPASAHPVHKLQSPPLATGPVLEEASSPSPSTTFVNHIHPYPCLPIPTSTPITYHLSPPHTPCQLSRACLDRPQLSHMPKPLQAGPACTPVLGCPMHGIRPPIPALPSRGSQATPPACPHVGLAGLSGTAGQGGWGLSCDPGPGRANRRRSKHSTKSKHLGRGFILAHIWAFSLLGGGAGSAVTHHPRSVAAVSNADDRQGRPRDNLEHVRDHPNRHSEAHCLSFLR